MKSILTLLISLLISNLSLAQLVVQRQLPNLAWQDVIGEIDLGERQLLASPTPRTTFRIVNLGTAFALNPSPTIAPILGVASDFSVAGLGGGSITSATPDVFTVALEPTTLGLKKATIQIQLSTGQSLSFVVFGDGIGNNALDVYISSSPNVTGAPFPESVNFGSANLSTAQFPSRWIRFYARDAPVSVSSISLSGPFEFVGAAPTSLSLPQYGTSALYEIRFKPLSAGSYTGSFSVVSSALTSFTSSTLSGTATGVPLPVISLESSSTSTGDYSVVSTQDSFGTLTQPTSGTTSVTRYYRIQNTGIAPLVLSGASALSNGFTFLSQPSGTIQPGAYGSYFAIRFTGSSAGSYTTSLNILSNASGAPRSLHATISLNANSLDVAAYNASTNQYVPLTNGNNPIEGVTTIRQRQATVLLGDIYAFRITNNTSQTIQNIYVTPPSAPVVVTDTSTFSLAPGEQRFVGWGFNPTEIGVSQRPILIAFGPPTAPSIFQFQVRVESVAHPIQDPPEIVDMFVDQATGQVVIQYRSIAGEAFTVLRSTSLESLQTAFYGALPVGDGGIKEIRFNDRAFSDRYFYSLRRATVPLD